MKTILALLIVFLFVVSSCHKEEIEDPTFVNPTWVQEYKGDWYIGVESYRNWNQDSVIIYNAPLVILTLSDSLLNVEEDGTPYYYGTYFPHGEMIEIAWSLTKIHLLSNTDLAMGFGEMTPVGWLEYTKLTFPEPLTSFDNEFQMIKQIPQPLVLDSITYRVDFGGGPPPRTGILVRYVDNDGLYTIDTLKSGNWQWEKRVAQSGAVKKYDLEVIGATDLFYEELASDWNTEYGLYIRSESYPAVFLDNGLVMNKVGAVFHKSTTDVTFSTYEFYNHQKNASVSLTEIE